TFWLGYIGTALIFLPVTFILLILAQAFLSDAAFNIVVAVWFCLISLYYIALFMAVVRKALSTPEARGWRWAAVLFALLSTMGFLARVYAYLVTI
ncbi:MAG: hypothetical protein LBI75_08260, partial [Brucellaceae bacterium]|nr:hypothetical protein [Brucellaceae bacterium]